MEQLLNIVKTVAPTIATAMGGPLAGMAVRTLSETLLGHPDGTEEELAHAAVTASPDQLLALKHAENNFKLEMKKLDVDLERISAGDRDSARQMAMQNPRDWTPRALAAVITVGFFGVLMYMLMFGLPTAGGGEEMLRWCERILKVEGQKFAIQDEEKRIVTGAAMIADLPIYRRF